MEDAVFEIGKFHIELLRNPQFFGKNEPNTVEYSGR